MAARFPWRQAATLILARNGKTSKESRNRNEKQTELLYIKRSSRSSDVFSSQYAFPGGTLDPADSSERWLGLYGRLGTEAVWQCLHSRVQLYAESGLSGKGVPAHVAFRICAIREVFEETGLLLCLGLDGLSEGEFRSLPERGSSHFTKITNLSEWRESVHSDASRFLDLCSQYNCVPNVWCLVEWSNWLTPPYLAKRWDTVFYVSTMDESVTPSADKVEVSSVNWFRPKDILEIAFKGERSMPVPTAYESNRINRFHDTETLTRFCRWRAEHYPCTRFSPDIRSSDKYRFLALLPGDGSYGKREDRERGLGAGESGLVNRYALSSSGESSIVCNAVPIDGHLAPSLFTQRAIKSKL